MGDAPERPWGHVHCRRATPADASAVCSMVLHCSAESLYGRFLTVVPPDTAASMVVDSLTSETAIWWLAEVDPVVVAIGATHMFDDGAAEISLLVEDAWQRRGVGRALLPHLVAEARTRRAPHVWATALGERMPIIRKLARAVGGSLEVSLSGGIAEMTADLPASQARHAS
jgi:GNAT superfamily N-acetyltransferase